MQRTLSIQLPLTHMHDTPIDAEFKPAHFEIKCGGKTHQKNILGGKKRNLRLKISQKCVAQLTYIALRACNCQLNTNAHHVK